MQKKYLLQHLFGTLVFFTVPFISAGRLDYWQGWMYVGLGLVMFALNHSIFQPDEALRNERAKPGEGGKKWDKILLLLSFFMAIAMYVVAGMDSGRFGWSPAFSVPMYIAGFLLTAIGQLLFMIAQKQNKFFSSTVRIQTDRGHQVCESGLYKIVRHPGYMGTFIQTLGFPLLFGSVWSTIPVAISILILFTRTQLEDQTLLAELEGYKAYSLKTRYKLIPYVF